MMFHLNDSVGKIGQWNKVFTIVGVRQKEPRCRIQRGADSGSREWILTDDLELLSRPSSGRGTPVSSSRKKTTQ